MTVIPSEVIFFFSGLLIGVILVRYGIGLGAKMTNEGFLQSPPMPGHTGEEESEEPEGIV